MTDDGDEMAGCDVTLEATMPVKPTGRRDASVSVGTMPYEWIVSIRALLGKYFRGCLDCGTGRCGKCVDADRWMRLLDYNLAGAKAEARRQALERKAKREVQR